MFHHTGQEEQKRAPIYCSGPREAAARNAQGTQVTRFTGTKVQVLTLLLEMPKALRAATAVGPLFVGVFSGVLILLYSYSYKCVLIPLYVCPPPTLTAVGPLFVVES